MARIAIIGAGPAGCAAAITVARAGATAHLFERGAPNKDKPCGDALLPDAVQALQTLGVPPAAYRARARSFDRVDLWNEQQSIWMVPVGDGGWIAPRAVIDQFLRDVAASVAELRYHAAVRAIDYAEGRWRLSVEDEQTTYDGVILATGATNALSRGFQVAGTPTVGASVSSYARRDNVTAPLFQFAPLGVDGYGWVFPLADGWVNIGICAVEPGHKSLQTALAEYLRRWDVTDAGPLRGGAGPFWSGHGSQWHDRRGLLSCGDAAGLVDPLTGEGIAPALESGRMAAECLGAFLREGRDPAALVGYSAWVATTFRRRYALTPARRTWAYLNDASGQRLNH